MNYLSKMFEGIFAFAKNNGFLLYFAPEKALGKWDEVYEIVAVTSYAAVMPNDFHKHGCIC